MEASSSVRSGLRKTSISHPQRGPRKSSRSPWGNLVECLSFTIETHEEFSTEWLPTLDMSLKIDENNQVQYQFFKKPTASKK